MTIQSTQPEMRAVIETLLRQLASDDPVVRAWARRELAIRGPAALEQLVRLLSGPSEGLRREAASTLSVMGNPGATDALIGALDDQRGDVRWLAANGLISIGQECLPHLLRALVDRPQDIWLRQGAHHVLRAVGCTAPLRDVLHALEGPVPWVEVPVAAYRALSELQGDGIEREAAQ